MKINAFKTMLIFSVVLFVILGSTTCVFANDFNNPILYVDAPEYGMVKAFDMMPSCNYDDFQPEKPVTRAEFARILCAAGGISPAATTSKFTDISNNKYKNYISAAYNYGLMEGDGSSTFMPDRNVTINEVLKSFVTLTGYKLRALLSGGYPKGYVSVANSFGITSEITTSGTEYATRGDISRIIYNSANVKLGSIIVDEYKSSSYDTLMKVYWGVDRVKGLVTDNGITGIDSETSVDNGIRIDGVAYLTDNLYNTREFIGRYVEAYCSVGSNVNKIMYISLDKDKLDEEIIFDISDFIEFDQSKLIYNGTNNVNKTVDLTDVNVIFNNSSCQKLSQEMFDYDYGTVRYVPAHGTNKASLIIEGFVSWYIDEYDYEGHRISTSNLCKPIEGTYDLVLPADKIGKTIFIQDEYGLEADFIDITKYSVIDICFNDEIIYIKIAPQRVWDKQISTILIDEETYISFTDGTAQKVSSYYRQQSGFNSICAGNVYYVYKNNFGEIVTLIESR